MPTENRSSNTEMVSDKLPPCADDVFKNGVSACLVGDVPKHAAETICQSLSAVTGWKIDWHYFGGRTHIKVLAPAPQPHPEPIAWMVGTAFWWTKEEADRDAATSGKTITPFGPMFDTGEVERLKQELLVARAQGRAEVVEMIAQLDAETGLDEFIGSHAIADTGDYGSHWNEDELRQHFNADPAAASELEMCRYSAHQIIQLEEEVKQLQEELGEAKGEYDRSANKVAAMAARMAAGDALLHKLKETLQREYWDEYAGLDETRELIDAALSASAEPIKPAAPYPNRLCHIDYTANPYLCGCLKGDDEAQRIYDEHCRAALERQP
ncbi:hypothetical protein [Pseudomonas sp. NY15354]|uniref:hypothetical protein n=1 Tax=Pseudomonas sp. NY15354 TaxID=3400351 RepID=UPI003A8AE58E